MTSTRGTGHCPGTVRVSVTKNIKAPALTIHLDKAIRKDKNEAKKVLNRIQTTFFKDIVRHSKIYFDPDDFNTTVEEDKLFLATYKEFIQEELMETSNLTPWLLRFEFDKEKIKEFDITMTRACPWTLTRACSWTCSRACSWTNNWAFTKTCSRTCKCTFL